MSPLMVVKPEERTAVWLTFDFRDDPEIRAIVIFPAYGPDHHVGADCWCHPAAVDSMIVHNKPPH